MKLLSYLIQQLSFNFDFSIVNSIINQVSPYCVDRNGYEKIRVDQCQCNNQICSEGMQCNENIGGCTTHAKSIFDNISQKGYFTFSYLLLNEGLSHSFIKQDSKLQLIDKIPGNATFLDNNDGTYWVKNNTRASGIYGVINTVFDNVIELRRIEGDKVLKSGQFIDIDMHELRHGNHPQEIICIKYLGIKGDAKVEAISAINIIDFSQDPPTETIINPYHDFDSQLDWSNMSTSLEWFHANSVGVDNHGNYYMFIRHGSCLIVYDRYTHKKMQKVATEFRSDYSFYDPVDKFFNSHDVHQLPNGNWLFFDNGNNRQFMDQYSRCVEYSFDHANKMVKKEWEFKLDKMCWKTGSCRRLQNGNTVIGAFNCKPYTDFSISETNQVQEVEPITNSSIGIITIPWAESQVIYRAIPSITTISYWKQISIDRLIISILSIIIIIFLFIQLLVSINNKQNFFKINIEIKTVKQCF